MAKERRFIDPHDVPPIPKTEGWERMYPYYYRFVPKGTDREMERYESSLMWFVDSLHQTGPLLPFETSVDDAWWPSFSQVATRIMCFPTAKGADHRMLYGWVYLASLEEEDPTIIEAKGKVVQNRMGMMFQDWDKWMERWKKKQYEVAKSAEELRFGDLPEMVDDAYILNHVGCSPASEMRRDYWKLMQIIDLVWEYHFEFFVVGVAAFVSFTELCKRCFPGVTDVTIGKMCVGAQYDSYMPEVKLQELSKLAIDLGLADAIMKPGDATQVEARLQETEAGRKWQAERDKYRDPYFYIGTGFSVVTHEDRCWNDDLNLPLDILRGYIPKLQQGKTVEKDVEARKRAADKLSEEYRGLITDEGAKAMFDQLLPLARRGLDHSESHMFWGESQYQPRMYNKLRELSQVFCTYDMLEDPGDIWYLNRFEIPQLIHDLTIAWAQRTRPRASWYWKPEIRWRKEVFERMKDWNRPTFLGKVPEKVTDPVVIGLWGITGESIKDYFTAGQIKPEEMTEFKGFGASAGVVEGKARVLTSVHQIDEVQDGEILVVTLTSPTWGPVFSKVGAVVTDIGGVMSHAGIVCREYGLPAVTGTGYATKGIKTGDILRVDGDTGIVKIVK